MPNSKKSESPTPDAKINLGDVSRYFGVNRRVVGRLVKEGTIKPITGLLDNRRKLVSMKELGAGSSMPH